MGQKCCMGPPAVLDDGSVVIGSTPYVALDTNAAVDRFACDGKPDPERRRFLRSISEENYNLRSEWSVPRTVSISRADCNGARLNMRPKDPVVSFSGVSTADAMLRYATDPKVVVCGLNFANGSKIGGGYKTGAVAQEEDLCRRIPNLYPSLLQAERYGLYPFGPCTYAGPQNPGSYSTVLYTSDLTLARLGEERGYEMMEKRSQRQVSLVTAAAPNIAFANDVSDPKLMYETVKSMFIAPRLSLPEVTTLVLGAWGCGAFGGNPAQISELFAQALTKDKLGRLYQEVHFAIPPSPNADAFRATFKRQRLKFKDL